MPVTSTHWRRRVVAASSRQQLPSGGDSFDPWRFDRVRIPPELKRELLGLELPRIPTERLYRASTKPVRSIAVRMFAIRLTLVTAALLVLGVIWWGVR